MRTEEEHRQHVRAQKCVTAAVAVSIVVTSAVPELKGLCAGLELAAVLIWIWIE